MTGEFCNLEQSAYRSSAVLPQKVSSFLIIPCQRYGSQILEFSFLDHKIDKRLTAFIKKIYVHFKQRKSSQLEVL